MKRFKMKLITIVLAAVVTLSIFGAETIRIYGQESNPAAASEKSNEQIVKLPQTPQEHLAMAENYRRKAIEYRQEAEYHRKMNEEYRKKVTFPKEIRENSYAKKMRIHCEKFIKAAQEAAREAEMMADFHTMRAKELQGK